MKKFLAPLAALFMAAAVIPASAGVKVGTLTCDVGPGVGFVIGSSKDMTCEFHDFNGKTHNYVGNVSRLGIDIGYTQATRIIWSVVAPTWKDSNQLEGTYIGASTEATLGVGVGANVLVGGLKKSITLQPISIQGQAGLDAALAAASMTLHAR